MDTASSPRWDAAFEAPSWIGVLDIQPPELVLWEVPSLQYSRGSMSQRSVRLPGVLTSVPTEDRVLVLKKRELQCPQSKDNQQITSLSRKTQRECRQDDKMGVAED